MTQTLSAPIAYLLTRLLDTTATAGETPAQTATRHAAVRAMFDAFAPADAVQAMLVCQCISLDAAITKAIGDFINPPTGGAAQPKSRPNAIALSRQMHQWLTMLTKLKAEAAKAARMAAAMEAKAEEPAAQEAATPDLVTPDPGTPDPEPVQAAAAPRPKNPAVNPAPPPIMHNHSRAGLAEKILAGTMTSALAAAAARAAPGAMAVRAQP